jgi:hypothetical protein
VVGWRNAAETDNSRDLQGLSRFPPTYIGASVPYRRQEMKHGTTGLPLDNALLVRLGSSTPDHVCDYWERKAIKETELKSNICLEIRIDTSWLDFQTDKGSGQNL